MAVTGIGTDIIETERINASAKRSFLKRIFTDAENDLFAKNSMRPETIAGNFAAKEAFVKALGTGFNNISPRDIEVLRDKRGKPYINLYGEAKNYAAELNVANIHTTISHCKLYATAAVVLESFEKEVRTPLINRLAKEALPSKAGKSSKRRRTCRNRNFSAKRL